MVSDSAAERRDLAARSGYFICVYARTGVLIPGDGRLAGAGRRDLAARSGYFICVYARTGVLIPGDGRLAGAGRAARWLC